MYEALSEAFGLTPGQRVRVLEVTRGADHEDTEHVVAAGAIGVIDFIEKLPAPQGVSFTVAIPVDSSGERHIVNVFDQSDGPIDQFLQPV